MIIALVNEAPDDLPVGALVNLLVEGGVQATHALPIIDGEFRTAVAGWRSSGTITSVAQLLDPTAGYQWPRGDAPARLRSTSSRGSPGGFGRRQPATT